MSIGGKVNGFTNAIRTGVVNQWGKDATIGGARATRLAERDVAGLVGIVGDD